MAPADSARNEGKKHTNTTSKPASASPNSRVVGHTSRMPVEWSYADPDDDDAIVAGLPGTDVYLGVIFKKHMAAAADSLQMIALHAAGFEKIDPASVPDGVVVVNAYEHEAPIAGLAAACLNGQAALDCRSGGSLLSSRSLVPLG